MARSTVANWITNYDEYITTVKQGNITYYKRETLDVLRFIKACRAENYQRQEIIKLLAEEGFPIVAVEADETLEKVVSPADQNLKKTAATLTKNNESTKTLQDKQNEDIERIAELKRQLAALKEAVAAMTKKQEQGLLARILRFFWTVFV